MPKPAQRNAFLDKLNTSVMPDSASAPESAAVSAIESASASASASADVPEQFSVRVRPSTKRAIEGYVHGVKLKKGPATDALWNLLIAGRIDVKLVRDEIRKMRGDA